MGQAMKAEVETGDAEERAPRRRWWLWRIMCGYVVFVMVVVVVRWRAGVLAERRLGAEVGAIRARGERIVLEDFREPVVSEEENAATYLNRAGDLLAAARRVAEQEKDLEEMATKWPLSAGEMAVLERVMGRHGDVLAEVRKARGKEAVAWGMKVESPAMGILLPWVGSQRQVSRLLMGAAVYAHGKGDDGAAAEYLRDGLMVSRAVDRSPVLICHLVAIGIANQTAGLAGAMAGELRIGGAGGASGEQVMGLIGELMDDGAMRAGLVGAMEGERMFQYDTVMSLAQRRLGLGNVVGGAGGDQANVMERWGARAISPMLMNEGREMLRLSNQMVEACRAEDGALASARIPALPGVTGGGMRYRTPVTSMLVPSLGAAMGRHYAGVYAMRGAGIELAGRMYEVETGKKAERLEDLLPKYLKEVPRDPVAGGGKAMPFAAGAQPSGR